MKQLSDVLIERGLIAADDIAVIAAQPSSKPLGATLVERGLISEAQLVAAVADQIGLRFVDLAEITPDPAAIALVPAQLCRRHGVVPVGFEGGRLVLAMADPSNVVALDDVRSLAGRDVRPAVATRADVRAAIDRWHRADSDLDVLTSAMDSHDERARGLSVLDDEPGVDDAPVVRFVSVLITQAVTDRASDIHLEPEEDDLRVRFRIDGVLHEVMRAPRGIAAGVVSRLKIMSEMNIAERRVPQDGRISTTVAGRSVDLRVATLPTVWGEKVVMRILDNGTARLTLADLGFGDWNYTRFSESFTKPYGMILVTGPTGSGKSTTLYSTLNIISHPGVNVITVEDPVEYRLPGINQVQVNPKAGLTFATALRSILRSDPDVVLLGEIRDHETAIIATEAALTGHLVLSTLHTNDAPSAITRLVEMGIEPFLVGSAIECVLAQRLARRLCRRCREAYQPSELELARFAGQWPDGDPQTLYRSVGCAACSNTGFAGRLALHEVMTIDEQIERLTVSHASAAEIGRAAREAGMLSLRQDGLAKAAAGLTTLEEMLRVVV